MSQQPNQPSAAPTTTGNTNSKQEKSTKSNKKAANGQQQATATSGEQMRQGTPMIVERVNKIPAVHFAISLGYTQYDRLKASNATIGQVMNQAENFAAYLWQKVRPYVTKLQEPIDKADQLACNTLDFVESKIEHVKTLKTQAVETLSTGLKSQI